jgi:hypothetical protein
MYILHIFYTYTHTHIYILHTYLCILHINYTHTYMYTTHKLHTHTHAHIYKYNANNIYLFMCVCLCLRLRACLIVCSSCEIQILSITTLSIRDRTATSRINGTLHAGVIVTPSINEISVYIKCRHAEYHHIKCRLFYCLFIEMS